MKIFFDTEFWEHDNTIQLISVGLVREDGLIYYAERAEFDWAAVPADHWIQANVRTHLLGGKALVSDTQLRQDLIDFAGSHPEFWAWYASYDWVALCFLFGSMMKLPRHWPMFCMDLRAIMQYRGVQQLDLRKIINTTHEGFGPEHNALADAKCLAAWYNYLWSNGII